jgi:hypothetical protein
MRVDEEEGGAKENKCDGYSSLRLERGRGPVAGIIKLFSPLLMLRKNKLERFPLA